MPKASVSLGVTYSFTLTEKEAAKLDALLKQHGCADVTAYVRQRLSPSKTEETANRLGHAISSFIEENPEAVETLKKTTSGLGFKLMAKVMKAGM